MATDLRPFARIFALNTDLLLNATDGLHDDEATRPVQPHTNSIAFLVAHLTDTRHYLAALAGQPSDNPLAKLLQDAKSGTDIREWAPCCPRSATKYSPRASSARSREATPPCSAASRSRRSTSRITSVRSRSCGACWATRR